MNTWMPVLILYLFWHTSWGTFREMLVMKRNICAKSAQLPINQSFTLVTGVVQCAHLFLASGEIFMLVRHGADGVVECGLTSALPGPISCKTGDVEIYSDAHTGPVCHQSSLGTYQHLGTTFCVHRGPIEETYDDAEDYCSSLGGMVVELEKRDDLVVFKNFVIGGAFWVGGDDKQIHGEYRWNNGHLVDPALFTSIEPDGVNEHCLVCYVDWGLADLSCDARKLTVCAIPAR